jgi:hypothetical protein
MTELRTHTTDSGAMFIRQRYAVGQRVEHRLTGTLGTVKQIKGNAVTVKFDSHSGLRTRDNYRKVREMFYCQSKRALARTSDPFRIVYPSLVS